MYMSVLLHATIILLPSRSPPPQLKILYESLLAVALTTDLLRAGIQAVKSLTALPVSHDLMGGTTVAGDLEGRD